MTAPTPNPEDSGKLRDHEAVVKLSGALEQIQLWAAIQADNAPPLPGHIDGELLSACRALVKVSGEFDLFGDKTPKFSDSSENPPNFPSQRRFGDFSGFPKNAGKKKNKKKWRINLTGGAVLCDNPKLASFRRDTRAVKGIRL